ncbi:odorant receptor 94a-like isoform X1 [Anopheles stephensi]|uniref:odorant receptor 94a-like isoform X1 n=1 Tax=Anopheles stephensi TaxID=30069 RepID=UPI0016588E92|nr:odorant receptor 94a-like isoform X1 [Anopheles stephensi]
MYETGRFIFPMRFTMWAWKLCGVFNAPVPKSLPYRVYCYTFYSCIMALYLFVLMLNVFVPQPFEQRVFFIMYIALTETAMILKTSTIYRYFDTIWDLYETTLGPSYQPRDGRERALHDRTLLVFNRWYYVYIFVSHMAAFGTGSHLLSSEYRMPFFPWFFGIPYGDEARVAYYTIFVYQCFGMYFHMLLNTAGDTQLCYMLQMIGIQLDLLAKRFRSLSDSEEFDHSFVPLVQHYNKIHRMLCRVENLFSLAYFVQFSVSGLVICASAYQVASMVRAVLSTLRTRNLTFLFSHTFQFNLYDFSKLMNVFYMMSMTMQIGLPCYYGNEVTLKSYALTNAIYSSNWYSMKQSNRKSVQMFLVRTNKPFAATAFRYFNFNLPAFTTILNMAYSVYCVLQRKAKNV